MIELQPTWLGAIALSVGANVMLLWLLQRGQRRYKLLWLQHTGLIRAVKDSDGSNPSSLAMAYALALQELR